MLRASSIACRSLLAQTSSCGTLPSSSKVLSVLSARRFSLDSSSKDEMEKIVKSDKVVVFMKGVPEQPMCGFSNAVVQIMRMHGVPFSSVDVLQNEDIRKGVKEYADWPTIPQVYFNGEFVGGCDILLQMHRSGDLVEKLQELGIRSAVLDAKTEETNSEQAK